MMKNTKYAGRRYVKLVRCSTLGQADTSTVDQSNLLDEYAEEHGMVHAGEDVVLDGISGSIPSSRDDIQAIIERKKTRNDFDVLLVQDLSRLTRGGIAHGNKVVWDLAEVGIEVVVVTQHSTGDLDQDSLLNSVGFFAAQQQAKSCSYASQRGVMSSLTAGVIPHSSKIAYGIDRLYVGLDGTKRYRIRNLADGTQQKLEVDGDKILGVYEKNPKKGASVHHRRQSDEKILLVPGDPRCREVVNRIFRMHLLEGKGWFKIAQALNDEGIPSPSGKMWATEAIGSILTNSTYLGVGIAGRFATGMYTNRGSGATPKTVKRDACFVAQHRKGDFQYRPKDEWQWVPHPLMTEYLDSELREPAGIMQLKAFEKQSLKSGASPKKAKPGGDKHSDSPYILKDVLRSKQGNYPMRGQLSGPKGDRRRYYGLSRAFNVPQSGHVYSRTIQAESLERAVLAIIKEALLDLPNLRKRIAEHVEVQEKQFDETRTQVQPLLDELEELRMRLTNAAMMGPASRNLIENQVSQWESRAQSIQHRIASVQSSAKRPAVDVNEVADAIFQQFEQWVETLSGSQPAMIRKLLTTLVPQMHADLETREVEMKLAIPPEMHVTRGDEPLRLVGGKPSPWPNEAQRSEPLKIAEIRCEYVVPKGQPRCYSCSRRAA